jgi:RHS repeat-associated protein
MTERENLLTDSVDQHEYDGDMRRMRSKLNNAANWTNFIHDELTENLLCEYTLVSGTFTVKALKTYGMGLISSNRQSAVRYFHFDGLGTTYHLTDTSQNVTDSYTYNAFGVPLSASGSSVNPYRCVGQWGYYDDGAMGSSSEMLLLGVRYYWPRFGRFVTWDPRHITESYYYCKNSSTMWMDPTGFRGITDLFVGPTYRLPRRRRPLVIKPFYGGFCGAQSEEGVAPGIDELDMCCEAHDNCWKKHGCNVFNQRMHLDCAVCTLILCACALRARCSLISIITANCLGAKAGVILYACTAVSFGQKLQLSLFGAPNCHGDN